MTPAQWFQEEEERENTRVVYIRVPDTKSAFLALYCRLFVEDLLWRGEG
jgi:hypothetical protein